MKTIGTIVVSALTTIATIFAVLFYLELEIAPISAVNDTIPVFSTQKLYKTNTFSIVNQEEAQISAIEKVAEAIVGVVITTDGFGGVLGGLGNTGVGRGSGSGVVYAVRNGNTYIATNEHVIDRAQTIEIVFNDELGTRHIAELVGKDVYTDLAVLRINDFEAEVVAGFGRTEDLRIGQTVMAIGNPLGLEFAGSATKGVVSGHDRSVSIPILSTNGHMQNWAMTVLQTDTAINPGNSGGALINLAGEVVGINSMKIAQSAIEGMSFSIPTYIALPIIEDLENDGVVNRPMLGVSLHNVSALPNAIREEISLPTEVQAGVFVQEIIHNSLAILLALEPGDVITHIGQIPIVDAATFRQTLFTYRVGDKIELTIIRNGSLISTSADIEISSP